MKILGTTALLALLLTVALPASAQSDDTAAERARLANERIQLEAQRRAEEERSRQERAASESAAPAPRADSPAGPAAQEPRPSAAPAPQPPPAPPPATPRTAADDERISRALEQLRELGELRDSGYVTDEEFERIKARILENRF